MEGWMAVTHFDWYTFLSIKPYWDEVNFWSPSDYYAFRGTLGAPYLFKLTAPHNAIAGFGIYSRFDRLPDWLAWECFQSGNGARTYSEFVTRLNRLRAGNRLKGGSGLKQIGCTILTDVVFFPREFWIPQPADWGRQNLRYTRYDLSTGEGRRVWEACKASVAALAIARAGDRPEVFPVTPARYGDAVLIRPRLGQGAFRAAVTDAYARACAVTQEHSLPVLEAAHIKPYSAEGPHEVRNGLLLRSDLHRLFDKGYLTVTDDLRIEVSSRLREDYSNGRSYYPLHGQAIVLPSDDRCTPASEFLRWHNDHRYLA
jgi:putative restriction endonuclease